MTARRTTRERRKRVAEAIAEGRSMRSIAREERVDHKTILRDRDWLEKHADLQRPAPAGAAGPGNTRGVKHGATSAQLLAPLIADHAAALRHDFPWLDDRRLAILADRLARIDQASAWVVAQGGVVKDELGRTYDIVDRLEKWSNRAEQILAELHAEDRERAAHAQRTGLASVVAEIADTSTPTEPEPQP
jgi:hypothetical protein